MTQKNSRQRVKIDSVGDTGLKLLYTQYESQSVTGFRALCKSLIEQSTGKRETKDKFLYVLDKSNSKNDMLLRVNNYLLAGMGLGV